MKALRRSSIIIALGIILGMLIFLGPAVLSLSRTQKATPVNAQSACQQLQSPREIQVPTSLINFDDLQDGTVIDASYQAALGVAFENSNLTRATIIGNDPNRAQSAPNYAANIAVAPNTSSGVPMQIVFDKPKTHVGFYLGNADPAAGTLGVLTGYDSAHNLICQVSVSVPYALTTFLGFYDPDGRIKSISLDYGATTLSEAIDDLYFAPAAQSPRQPQPTWTAVPSPTPTPGPTPTPKPILPLYAYHPITVPFVARSLVPDLSIFGSEITQGIQCFDPSKGLSGCPDNSLPVVTQKGTSARIYLKITGASSMNGVPVRLYIRANNVWYQADASGRATSSLNQSTTDSANIYFNVNFSNNVAVDFYAVVDPNNTIFETNESNNRWPASGYLTLTFQRRKTLKIVGERLYYHPSGYSGSQYAGGWAVNGGGATWLTQLLPLRDNGIDYSVNSGYLNWTENLSSGDSQHDLIKTTNLLWIMQNTFSWIFGTGSLTGANHLYGWAPSAGYSGGHADMPIYPHAGGLGVVGIGSDAPGASTDAPGSGALIFGHELVHDYNVFHTNTPDACGSNDNNSNFPYPNSSIQDFGVNPGTGKIYDPALTHDLMSYCPSGGAKQGWISPFTWNTMFNKLVPSAAITASGKGVTPGGAYSPSSSMESLVVNATVFNPLYKPAVPGKLGTLYRVANSPSYTTPTGDYAIELRDAAGKALASQPFIVDFSSEYSAHGGPSLPDSPPPFPPDPTHQIDVSMVIPWVEGTTSIALVYQGQVLDQRAVSGNPPQVQITSPTQPVDWPTGSTQPLTWTGSDPDNDLLTYDVFYSPDAGGHWSLVADGLTGTSYPVVVDAMAGGSDVRFRVVASDGVNTAFDETKANITIPNHPPQVTILEPASGAAFLPGGLVVLQGSATDFEDGSLPDEALSWSSDVQGGLGTGASLPIASLLPGAHTITLTAIDSYGITSSASVKIFVGYQLDMPVVVKNR